jgi:hypothetical protein
LAAIRGLVSGHKKPPRITTEVVARCRCCYRKGRHASRESDDGAVEEDDACLSGKLAATAAARSRGMQAAVAQMLGLDDGDALTASSCVK